MVKYYGVALALALGLVGCGSEDSEDLESKKSYYGIAQTGQSLAEGGVGNDVIDGVYYPAFPGRTMMLNPSPIGVKDEILSKEVAELQESNRVTIGHSLTKDLAEGNENVYVFHGQAFGGQNYQALKKGGYTKVFEKIIDQVENVKRQYNELKYIAITNIHGEQDGLDGNENYHNDLIEWVNDFNSDIKRVTSQEEDIIMYICQVSSSGGYGYNGGISENEFTTPIQQLLAHDNSDKVVLVTPKYFLPYYDHSHITNLGQRILGEYYAKAISSGSKYQPLSPSSIVGLGSKLTVNFKGRVGDLVFDTEMVKPIDNMGFQYKDDNQNEIKEVKLINNNVVINLTGEIGNNPVLSYAYHNGDGGKENQINGFGDRGNLRDSNSQASSYDDEYMLYNWSVIFRQHVLVNRN